MHRCALRSVDDKHAPAAHKADLSNTRSLGDDQPWSSASLFLFISLDTLCCAASCFASSIGTFDTGLLEISVQHGKGRCADQPTKVRGNARKWVRTLFEIVPACQRCQVSMTITTMVHRYVHDFVIIVGEERDCCALLASTTSTTCRME